MYTVSQKIIPDIFICNLKTSQQRYLTALSHSSVTDMNGAHLHCQGSEPAESANTAHTVSQKTSPTFSTVT